MLIYESEELKSTSFRKRVDMDISGVDQLTFRVDGNIFTKPLVGAITGSGDEFCWICQP